MDKFICAGCGCEFMARRKVAVRRFCSRACQFTHRCGEFNPNWKQGNRKRKDGRNWVYIAGGHPSAPKSRPEYILEYRLIAESKLGRSLEADEVVHHIDGNVRNNDPANLEVMRQSVHARKHRDSITNRFAKAWEWNP